MHIPYNANMLVYTLIGILFAFVLTVLGAALVFFFKKPLSNKLKVVFYGLSSGIMLAATIWSLILPGIDASISYGFFKFVPVVCGIFLGALFIVLLDYLVVKLRKNKNGLSKNAKIFIAVTIHNIPEGLAVGFAFGIAIFTNDMVLCYSALSLAIGMGLQNFPEGAAISLPMKKTYNNRFKAFMFGVYSASVEPIASVIGILLAKSLSCIFGYILGFAAGAMIYVLIEELLPEAKLNNKSKLGTWCFIIGFCFMMILDVVFS